MSLFAVPLTGCKVTYLLTPLKMGGSRLSPVDMVGCHGDTVFRPVCLLTDLTLRQGASKQAFSLFEKEHKSSVSGTMDVPSQRLESEYTNSRQLSLWLV